MGRYSTCSTGRYGGREYGARLAWCGQGHGSPAHAGLRAARVVLDDGRRVPVRAAIALVEVRVRVRAKVRVRVRVTVRVRVRVTVTVRVTVRVKDRVRIGADPL